MSENVGKIRKKVTTEQSNRVNEVFVLFNELEKGQKTKCQNCVLLISANDGSQNEALRLLHSNASALEEFRILPKFTLVDGSTVVTLPKIENARDAISDVVSTIETHLLFQNLSAVKILVTASFETLVTPEKQEKFKELLENLKSFLPNSAKFQHSIGLVVTGVMADAPTAQIQQSVVENLRNLQNRHEMRNSVLQMLLSMFLIEQNGSHTHLEILQTTETAIASKLAFASCQPNEFHTLGISETSHQLVAEILYTITHNTRNLLDETFMSVRQTCQDATEKFERLEQLNVQLMQLQNLRRQMETLFKDPKFKTSGLLDALRTNGFSIPERVAISFVEQEQHLTLLKTINAHPKNWLAEFEIFLIKVHSYEFIYASGIYSVMDQHVDSNFADILANLARHFETTALESQDLDATRLALNTLTTANQMIPEFTVEKFLNWAPPNVTTPQTTRFKENLMEHYKFVSFIQIYPELESIWMNVPSESDRFVTKVSDFAGYSNSTIAKLTERVEMLEKTGLEVAAISETIKEHFDGMVHRAPVHESRRAKAYMTDKEASLVELVREVEHKPDFGKFSAKIRQWLGDNNIEYHPSESVQKRTNAPEFGLWLENMKPATNHMKKLSHWVRFVDDLIEKLIDYESQPFIEEYDGNTERNETVRLKAFLESIKLPNDDLSEAEQNETHKLIKASTSLKRDGVACEHEKVLVMHDHFIRLSQLKKWLKLCMDAAEVRLFATHTLFIDDDLDFRTQGKSVYIFAPIWRVIGNRTIQLDGADGQAYPKAEVRADGVTGRNGEGGGNFFGVGYQFFNGENLRISANGGRGGAGQDGGDGTNGVNGLTATKPEATIRQSYDENASCDQKISNLAIAGYATLNQTTNEDGRTVEHFHVFGTNGTSGGDGSIGGSPGVGGSKGNVVLLELGAPSGVQKVAEDGQTGEPGKSGVGGTGGKHGSILDISCYSRVVGVWVAKIQSFYLSVDAEIPMGQAQNGANGTELPIQETQSARHTVPHTPSIEVFERYKQAVENIPKNPLSEFLVTGFVRNITNAISTRPKRATHDIESSPLEHYNTNSTLMLMDLLARKLTKVKVNPSNYNQHEEHPPADAMDLAYSFYANQNE